MTGLGPEVLDLAQRRWTWAKGTGLGPSTLDLQVLPSPAKSSLDLTGNDWTWQENLVHVPPAEGLRIEGLGKVQVRQGSGGLSRPPDTHRRMSVPRRMVVSKWILPTGTANALATSVGRGVWRVR